MPDLMNSILDAVSANAPKWLQERQSAGRKVWAKAELPTRKTEAWKYTSLHALNRSFDSAEPSAASKAELGFEYPDFGGCKLVFVDGYLREDLSQMDMPTGVQLVRFADADDAQTKLIQQHLGSVVDSSRHLFANLSDAALNDGVFVQIDAETEVTEPLHLIWLTTSRPTAFTVNQRLLVLSGANSRASLIEHFDCAGNGNAFTNGITELLLEDGATLHHHRLHLEEAGAMHIGGVHARLAKDSTLESFHLALGSDLKRIDVVINHEGPGAHCGLNGIYLLRKEEHVDYHTCIEHASPHCTTDEVFRGIIGDSASAVFNGRIHIHPDAQKTRAELSNRNLLTSAQAEINTKPELEIYADDVQCAHGATIAQLDPQMMHYLKTRGISSEEAEIMLSYGFINEVIDSIALKSLRDYLRPLLAKRFSRDPKLTRHLL
ncbi:MAG: Fe-S cluster assembly protein SufD [Halioglobus sp.]|jgi:Fe-S cluster assembly protein SufD